LLDPHRVLAYNNQAHLYTRQGRTDDTITAQIPTLSIDPPFSPTHYNRGSVCAHRDQAKTKMKETKWQQKSTQLGRGDVLLLYTDGVTEAQNTTGDWFDDDRLLAIGDANLGRSASEIQEAIIASVHEFVGNAPQFDDITLLVTVRE
jgi:hypothetical protein